MLYCFIDMSEGKKSEKRQFDVSCYDFLAVLPSSMKVPFFIQLFFFGIKFKMIICPHDDNKYALFSCYLFPSFVVVYTFALEVHEIFFFNLKHQIISIQWKRRMKSKMKKKLKTVIVGKAIRYRCHYETLQFHNQQT